MSLAHLVNHNDITKINTKQLQYFNPSINTVYVTYLHVRYYIMHWRQEKLTEHVFFKIF